MFVLEGDVLVFTDGDDVLLGVPVLVLDVLLLAAEVSPVEWVLQSESVHCLQEFWERSSHKKRRQEKSMRVIFRNISESINGKARSYFTRDLSF